MKIAAASAIMLLMIASMIWLMMMAIVSQDEFLDKERADRAKVMIAAYQLPCNKHCPTKGNIWHHKERKDADTDQSTATIPDSLASR